MLRFAAVALTCRCYADARIWNICSNLQLPRQICRSLQFVNFWSWFRWV